MRNTDIHSFLDKIDNQIKLISAYSENKHLYHLIKYCRLKPLSGFKQKFNFKAIELENKWFDEFGHTLDIQKDNIHLRFDDPELNDKDLINTDWLHGINLKKILNHSRFAILCVYENSYYLMCFGEDNFFRLFKDKQIISPLHFGLDNLIRVIKFIIDEIKIEELKISEIQNHKITEAIIFPKKSFKDLRELIQC